MESKIPTIKEIAKKLNISISTVSRALHDHPSIGLRTKMRVQELARQLNYEPNQAAIMFKKGKSMTIGVILPNLKEEFFSEAISGIEDVAKEKQYCVLIGQSHDDPEREKQVLTAMKNQRVDGIIVSLSKYTTQFDPFVQLEKYKIPVVYFDRVPDMPDVHKVYADLAKGTEEAVNFLVEKGHQRIALINGPREMSSCVEREKVFLQVMARHKIRTPQNWIVNTDLTPVGTAAAMEKLLRLKTRPTAVLTMNDYVALDAMQYARRQKIRINRDMSFVSYANLPITSYLEHPPLASVEQYPYEQASRAAEILFEIIARDEQDRYKPPFQDVIFRGKLVIHD